MVITSPQNSLVKTLCELKDKKGRKKQNAYLVEGVKMVAEAIKFNMPIKLIIGLKDIVESFCFNGEKYFAEEKVLLKLSDCETCQGVFAVIEQPKDNFIISKEPCVLLDRVRDPGNLGTIIRTSVALGIKNIYLLDTVDCYSPKVVRSSMSGIYSVNLMQIDSQKLQELANGLEFISADMCGENVFNFTPKNNFCLVMGNEANGLSEQVKSLTKTFVSIPMQSGIESLNVGVAFAVIGYRLFYKN